MPVLLVAGLFAGVALVGAMVSTDWSDRIMTLGFAILSTVLLLCR